MSVVDTAVGYMGQLYFAGLHQGKEETVILIPPGKPGTVNLIRSLKLGVKVGRIQLAWKIG